MSADNTSALPCANFFYCVLLFNLIYSLPSQAQEPANTSKQKGTITRAQFTSQVINREPQDILQATSTDISVLYFFSEARNMSGRTLIHRWRYFGEKITDISFSINGPRWRVNSLKTLEAKQNGEWSVEILDSDGNNYGEHAILVAAAGEATNASSTAPAVPTEAKASSMQPIFAVFPDGEYTLVDDTTSSDDCPDGGFFRWQAFPDQTWAMDMGKQFHMRVHGPDVAQSALRPDTTLQSPGSACVIYSSHHFNLNTSELVTDIVSDCEGANEGIFSAASLKRQDDVFELSLFGERYSLCSYRLK